MSVTIEELEAMVSASPPLKDESGEGDEFEILSWEEQLEEDMKEAIALLRLTNDFIEFPELATDEALTELGQKITKFVDETAYMYEEEKG